MKRTVIIFLAMMLSVVCCSTIFAQDDTAFIRRVRFIETDVLGIPNPAGLSFSRRANIFHIMSRSKSSASDIFLLTPSEDWVGSARIAAQIKDPINMAFDNKANRLLIFKFPAEQLLEVLVGPDGNLDPRTLTHHKAKHFGLQNPQGMTVDPESGHLFILDATGPRLIRVEPEPNGGFKNSVISQVNLESTGLVDPRGLALDPTAGHFHALNPDEQELYEFTGTGQLVTVRDMLPFGLKYPQGMVFAGSGDLTDDPSQVCLYIADSGLSAPNELSAVKALSPNGSQNGQIMELSLSAPLAPEASTSQANLVQVIDTSQFSPPSPDPAGIAYLSSSDRLLVSDSEVDEMSIFSGVNLFEMTHSGIITDTASTTPYSYEPTGATFNPDNGHLFFCDDNADEIFELFPGNDGLFFTGDDFLTYFDTRAFNCFDPEGVAFDSGLNALFIADGVNNEIYQITPGPNNIFDGVPPSGDDQATNFDTASLGVMDPEGIVFDSNSGNLYVVGEPRDSVVEVTTTGILVRVIDISTANARVPAGLALAPGSLNPTAINLYITDRGVDNNADPNENDGKVYEMSLQLSTPGNERPTVDAGPDQTITISESAILSGTVNDDGLPDPPAAVITTWSQITGPGTVTFADPSAINTTASFSQAGVYVLQLIANDGELVASDDLTIVVIGAGGEQVIEVRVAASSDDAEETFSGNMQLSSGDLDLGSKTVGVRFTSVNIPQGASIINAYLQFQADEIEPAPSSLTIEGEDVDDAPTFAGILGDITSRTRTTAAVSWSPPPWTSAPEIGPDQRTPNIATIIQEIVSRPFWSNGNSLVLIITGNGERAAESLEGNQAGAPLLHVEYTLDDGTNQPPTAAISAPADGAMFNEGDPISFTGVADDPEDGDVTASLSWISDIDGTIGTGGTFSSSDLSVGVHTITAMAMDSGGLTGSDHITITVVPIGGGVTIEVRVAAGSDDAEELFSGSMQLSSTDLDLGSKPVGLRFTSVDIPQGASIINAYLQFQADEIEPATSSLTIEGEDVDDAPTFTGTLSDITSRTTTTAAVSWSPPPWTMVGEAGPDQRTPNIASVIQEIVSRPVWASGNSLALIITGSGERAAESLEGNQVGAPLLHVEYTTN